MKTKKTDELRDKRAQLLNEARELTESEQPDLERVEELLNQADEIRRQIDVLQRVQVASEELRQPTKPALKPAPEDPRIGMSENEVRQYSLVRAIRAAATGDWSQAGLEREASEAVAKHLRREPNGFFVPWDFMERRDLVKGTPSAGGDLVATELMAQSFIDMLRNRLALRQAGITILSGLVGDLAIPRQTGGATTYWVAESGSPTESQQAVDQVALSPKTVGAYTDYSRKLLKQSSIDVEMFVRNDLAAQIALAIDQAGLHGSGASNEPTGIANVTGIGLVSIGTDGGAPTWQHIVQLETEVAQDNADVGRLAYVTNAKVRGKLKVTEKASGTAQFVWGEGPTPLNGYRAIVSNQVRSDLTKGVGTNLSAIFFGNWADLVLGMWGALDILVDPYTGGTSGTVRVIALQDVDFAVRHPESFAAILDASTV